MYGTNLYLLLSHCSLCSALVELFILYVVLWLEGFSFQHGSSAQMLIPENHWYHLHSTVPGILAWSPFSLWFILDQCQGSQMQSGGEGSSLSVLQLQRDSCEATNSSTSALWLHLLVKTELDKDEEEGYGRGRDICHSPGTIYRELHLEWLSNSAFFVQLCLFPACVHTRTHMYFCPLIHKHTQSQSFI